MTTRENPGSLPGRPPVRSEGSTLCLACGLCCDGVLHAHAVVKPCEIECVRVLGLKVEAYGHSLGFRLPCPLYRDGRCSIYTAKRPCICGAYQCELLKKYLAGAVTLKQAAPTIRRARELLADVIAQLPSEYSFTQLRRDLDQGWDSGRGVFGSAEMRQQNAAFLLTIAKLAMFMRKHFEGPKAAKCKK